MRTHSSSQHLWRPSRNSFRRAKNLLHTKSRRTPQNRAEISSVLDIFENQRIRSQVDFFTKCWIFYNKNHANSLFYWRNFCINIFFKLDDFCVQRFAFRDDFLNFWVFRSAQNKAKFWRAKNSQIFARQMRTFQNRHFFAISKALLGGKLNKFFDQRIFRRSDFFHFLPR